MASAALAPSSGSRTSMGNSARSDGAAARSAAAPAASRSARRLNDPTGELAGVSTPAHGSRRVADDLEDIIAPHGSQGRSPAPASASGSAAKRTAASVMVGGSTGADAAPDRTLDGLSSAADASASGVADTDSAADGTAAAPDGTAATRKPMPRDLYRHTLLLRLLYFLLGMSAASWGRFGTVYYMGRGLSRSQIGIIEGLIPAVTMFASPLWGIVADKIRSRKKIALFTQVISVSVLCLLAFPSIARGYGEILAISMIMAAFVSAGILDAHTLDVLGTDYFYDYGPIRLWSSISWGIGALIMGIFSDAHSIYSIFIIYGSLAFISVVALAIVVPDRTANELIRAASQQKPKLRTLVQALIRPTMLFFLFEIALFGAGMAVVERLLFIFLQDDLGASTTLCGLTVTVTVIFELPIFYYADWLLKKWGHHALFLIAMVSHTLRVFGYTLLTKDTVEVVLVFEIFHGVTFACMWTAAVEYAKMGVPPEWSSAAQTILAATLSCVGAGIGSVLGGYVMEHSGAVYLYRVTGFIGMATIAMHLAYLGISTVFCGGPAQVDSYSTPDTSLPLPAGTVPEGAVEGEGPGSLSSLELSVITTHPLPTTNVHPHPNPVPIPEGDEEVKAAREGGVGSAIKRLVRFGYDKFDDSTVSAAAATGTTGFAAGDETGESFDGEAVSPPAATGPASVAAAALALRGGAGFAALPMSPAGEDEEDVAVFARAPATLTQPGAAGVGARAGGLYEYGFGDDEEGDEFSRAAAMA